MITSPELTTRALAQRYLAAGFALCAIKPGSKGPTYRNWGQHPLSLEQINTQGLGLIHAKSGTCAIDLDDLGAAAAWLDAQGIDLAELLTADDAVQITSGRPNRGKLLYRLPAGVDPLPTVKVKAPGGAMMLELRCATSSAESDAVQDVLPPTIHPDTGQPYRWAGAGSFEALPELPAALLARWRAQAGRTSTTTSAPPLPAPGGVIGEGSRNDTLFRMGGDLARHGLPAETIAAALHQVNEAQCRPPLARHEVATIARSASVTSRGARDRAIAEQVDISGLMGRVQAASEGVQAHPLSQFVDFAGEVKPPRWVIPGFIAHGVVVIAGAHGVGKTTATLPLAMVAAGLHGEGDALAPRHWRHVVYITEDVEQARRILAGIVGWGELGLDMGIVGERLHIVEARRLEPAYAVQVSKDYRAQFTRTVDGVEVLPLVVVDTKSAVLAQEEENSNTEGSQIMAYLKQDFQGLPVWVIGHVSKANMNRSNASELSMRGGSAFEADAHQVLYLVKEADERRYLVRGKTRFEAEWPELQIQSKTAATLARDEFGNLETLVMRWGIAAPPEQSRKEAAEQAAEQQRKADEAALRDEVREAVATAWNLGNPLNRAGVKAKVRRKAQVVKDMIEVLLSERWLHEVHVPAKVRVISSKAAFLVDLTTEEHEAVLSGAALPAAKLVIPESWQKQAIPLVPEPMGEAEDAGHA